MVRALCPSLRICFDKNLLFDWLLIDVFDCRNFSKCHGDDESRLSFDRALFLLSSSSLSVLPLFVVFCFSLSLLLPSILLLSLLSSSLARVLVKLSTYSRFLLLAISSSLCARVSQCVCAHDSSWLLSLLCVDIACSDVCISVFGFTKQLCKYFLSLQTGLFYSSLPLFLLYLCNLFEWTYSPHSHTDMHYPRYSPFPPILLPLI